MQRPRTLIKTRCKGGEDVSCQEIINMLEKQLQLLSERSKECLSDQGLAALTREMVNLAELLLSSV